MTRSAVQSPAASGFIRMHPSPAFDSVWALQPLIRASVVMGYLPFTRSPVDGSLQQPTARVVWTLVVNVAHAAATFLFIFVSLDHEITRTEHSQTHTTTQVLQCVLAFRFWVEMFTMLSSALWQFPSWNTLSRNLACIDHHLMPETQATYRKRRRCLLYQMLIVAILLAAQTIMSALSWQEHWVHQIFRAVGHLSHMLLVLQYINIALILKDKFMKLNDSILGAESHSVQLLRRAHLQLCDVVGQTNGLYGWSLLALLCFLWGHVIINVHYLLRPRTTSGGVVGDDQAALLVFAGRETLTVVAVCAACEAAVTQARRTRHVLKHALLSPSVIKPSTTDVAGRGFMAMNPITKNSTITALEAFQRQVADGEPHFTAGGIFHIELPLLAAFFGTLVGYIIVLQQMEI